MKIINTITKEIIDITNIDFYKEIINGSKQTDKYSEITPILISSSVINTMKTVVDELLVNELLLTEDYTSFVKLSDYNDWLYTECPERAFFTFENIVYMLINHKLLVDDMFTDPVNPFIEYEKGKLIYFYTSLDNEVKELLNSLNIQIEYIS